MKKFKLDLNQLKIDSFETVKQPKGIGTIKGNVTNTESPQCLSLRTCLDDPTCRHTCNHNTCENTCLVTCLTCVDTCHTCVETCYETCVVTCHTCVNTCIC